MDVIYPKSRTCYSDYALHIYTIQKFDIERFIKVIKLHLCCAVSWL